MNDESLNKKLRELKIEDFIWVIYIGIIILSWISNNYERNYYIFKNLNYKSKYIKTIEVIFSILIVVYIYFLKNSVEDLKLLKKSDSEKKRLLVYLSFIASLLIAISGFIYLYIAFTDNDLDVELAFN